MLLPRCTTSWTRASATSTSTPYPPAERESRTLPPHRRRRVLPPPRRRGHRRRQDSQHRAAGVGGLLQLPSPTRRANPLRTPPPEDPHPGVADQRQSHTMTSTRCHNTTFSLVNGCFRCPIGRRPWRVYSNHMRIRQSPWRPHSRGRCALGRTVGGLPPHSREGVVCAGGCLASSRSPLS